MLLVLLASATAEQLDFGFENLVTNNVQIPLNFSDNYQVACDGNISQYLAGITGFLSRCCACLSVNLEPLPNL